MARKDGWVAQTPVSLIDWVLIVGTDKRGHRRCSFQSSKDESEIMEGMDPGNGGGTPRKGRGILVFVIGFVLGIVAAIVARPFLGERLPEAVGGKREAVEGPVAAKQKQNDRLLLTIVTPSGAILGTFKKKTEEISLLVEVGDTVALTIPGYQPFLEDPEITRVAKPMGAVHRPSAEPIPMDQVPDSIASPDSSQTTEEADSVTREQASRWY
jgi:hypothetical protein